MSSYNRPSIDADMDSFLDYTGGKSIQSPTSTMDPMSSIMSTEHADERQVLSGPSHEYGRFKQQTGLPSGAMSSVGVFGDIAGDNDFMSHSSLAQNGYSSMEVGYGSNATFDMDYANTSNTALPAFFFPGTTSEMHDFAESPGLPPTYNPQPVNPPRLWPGMHSQQAEQARAEATARQQQRQLQGQQIMQQRQRKQSTSSQMSTGSRKSRAFSQSGTDPIADEHISRILDNMRHNSTVSPIEEEPNPLEDVGLQSTKIRKEEDDMDDDERLLASEEGKKLSSKERRQLRNKVSARAFRSRRKEYISQLEGEVAAKANECNDLKAQNRKLADENNQLKNLTRTLLSHPAFQTFLEDASRDPSIITPFRDSTQSSQEVIESEEFAQSQQTMDQESSSTTTETQVNMASMPNNALGFSMLNLGNNHWAAQNPHFSFQQPQVFPLIGIPQGPSLEEMTIPRIPSLKELEKAKPTPTAAKLPSSATNTPKPISQHLTSLAPHSRCNSAFTLAGSKIDAAGPAECDVYSPSHEDAMCVSQAVEDLFESVDSSMERIDRLTSHLPRL